MNFMQKGFLSALICRNFSLFSKYNASWKSILFKSSLGIKRLSPTLIYKDEGKL